MLLCALGWLLPAAAAGPPRTLLTVLIDDLGFADTQMNNPFRYVMIISDL
jgi:hypothetical protein